MINLFPFCTKLHVSTKKLKRVLVVLVMIWIVTSSLAYAQQQHLVVQDTVTSTFVIHPDLPEAATVVLYSPLSNLVINSSIGFLDTSFHPQKGEYILSLRSNTAHMLTIEYPGFNAYELRIPPIDDGSARSYVVRPPSPFVKGMLVVEAMPADARIQVQGIEIGKGSVQLALCPGMYPVRISKEGYEPLEFSAEISLNESNVQRRAISLAKQPLTITSNVEGARVFFQGQEIGVAPVTDFQVDQGLAEIRVESPGYSSFVQMVDIRNDRNNVVDAHLETQIQLLPSPSIYVQNESASIEGNILQITYDLASEKKKYFVDVVFLGPDNQPIEVAGVRGDFGKKIVHGRGRAVFWPIPQNFSMEGVKVQVEARTKGHMGWYILGGGLGIGSGVAIAVLAGGNDRPEGGGGGPGGRP